MKNLGGMYTARYAPTLERLLIVKGGLSPPGHALATHQGITKKSLIAIHKTTYPHSTTFIYMLTASLQSTFDDTATDYDEYAILPRLVSERLIDHLEGLPHFQPTKILDLGCGTGFCTHLLHSRYPNAHIISTDCSYPLLAKAKATPPTLPHTIQYVQSDIEALPFKKRQFNLICANLSLLWIKQLPDYLSQLKQWLQRDGLLLFSGFSPGTFHPLYHPSSEYPFAFLDLHTLGDILIQAKWQEVVTSTDRFITQHDDATACYKELIQLGLYTLVNASEAVPETCSMHWEVVYGQAWYRQQSSTNPQEVAIPVREIRRGTL